MKLRELLTGTVSRLRYVIRFSTCRRVNDESVAEHSFFVAFIALLIGKSINTIRKSSRDQLGVEVESCKPDIHLETVLSSCLLHDLDECISGDFPRPFKYSSEDLARECHKACAQSMAKLAKEIGRDEDVQGWLYSTWADAKEETEEGRLVAFADFLSVLAYLACEVKGSNFTVSQHTIDMSKYLDIFKDRAYEFLRPWVIEAEVLVKEVTRPVMGPI